MAAKKEKVLKGKGKPLTREEALQTAIEQIQKQFGQGAIMRMGDKGGVENLDVISTGSITLDLATGIGGVPKGRIVEIYGPESSGKTTIALHIVAEAQKAGGRAAFIDAEHALDPVYAAHLGVNIEDLLVSQPGTGEEGLEICDALARSGAIDVIIVDSVAALVPRAEIEGDIGDSFVGLQARLMSQALRKLAGTVGRSNTCVIFINQLREKVGVMYGNPETTTGGRALKFYATIRMDVRRKEAIKKGDKFIGNRTVVKLVKNKVAPPFKKAEFDIMYGEGISVAGDLLDCATELGIMEKAGSWYSYGGDRIAQGRENVKEYLEQHPDVMESIKTKVKEVMRPGAEGTPELSSMDDADDIPLQTDEDGVILDE